MSSNRKSKAFCCVPNCNSKASRDPDVSFHLFPTEKQMVCRKSEFGAVYKCSRRLEWIRLLRIGKKVTKYMVVCSKHFATQDYILSAYPCKRHQLKKTALPSLNLPSIDSIKSKVHPKRNKRNTNVKEENQKEEEVYQTQTEIDREATETLLMLSKSKQGENISFQLKKTAMTSLNLPSGSVKENKVHLNRNKRRNMHVEEELHQTEMEIDKEATEILLMLRSSKQDENISFPKQRSIGVQVTPEDFSVFPDYKIKLNDQKS